MEPIEDEKPVELSRGEPRRAELSTELERGAARGAEPARRPVSHCPCNFLWHRCRGERHCHGEAIAFLAGVDGAAEQSNNAVAEREADPTKIRQGPTPEKEQSVITAWKSAKG